MTENNENIAVPIGGGMAQMKEILNLEITAEEKVNRINEWLGEKSDVHVVLIGMTGSEAGKIALIEADIREEMKHKARKIVIIDSLDDLAKLPIGKMIENKGLSPFDNPPIMIRPREDDIFKIDYIDRSYENDLLRPKKGKNSWKSPYKFHR